MSLTVEGLHGTGWTGVTDEDKRWAGGRAPDGANATVRARVAAQNSDDVAEAWGSKYWTSQSEPGVWFP